MGSKWKPLSVRHGSWRTRLMWTAKNVREGVALRFAPWLAPRPRPGLIYLTRREARWLIDSIGVTREHYQTQGYLDDGLDQLQCRLTSFSLPTEEEEE